MMDTQGFRTNAPQFLKDMYLDMDLDELMLFPLCVKRILDHIDKHLLDPRMNRIQISRLLTCRWILINGRK